MRRRALAWIALAYLQLGAGPPAVVQFLEPQPGAQLTWMPLAISLDFDEAAAVQTLEILLNGNDITSLFAIDPPQGGRRLASAASVWGGFVAAGANLLEASVELGGAPHAATRTFFTRGDPFADAVVAYVQGTGGGFNAAALPAIALGSPAGSGLFQGGLNVVSLGFSGSIVVAFTDNAIVDGPGVDFTVFENPFLPIGAGGILGPPFAEPGRVSASQNGVQWFSFSCSLTQDAGPYWPGCAGSYPVFSDGTLSTPHASLPTSLPIQNLVGQHFLSVQVPPGSGGNSFDLADIGLSRARYVKIEAASFATAPVGVDNAAFDLDAVAAVHSRPVLSVPALPWPGVALLSAALLGAAHRMLRTGRRTRPSRRVEARR